MDKTKIKNILIIRNDHIGDLILTTSAFSALKKEFPNSKITVICSKINKPIIEHNKNIDELIVFAHGKQFIKNFHKYFGVLWKLRKKKFDIGIDLRGDFLNIFFLMFMAGVKKRIGFYRKKASKWFLDYGLKRKVEIHETKYVIDVLNKGLGLKMSYSEPEIATTNSDKKETEEFIKKNNLKEFICIVPDSGHPLKQWPLDKFDKIIKFLKKEYPNQRIVLVGGIKEKLDWLKKRNPECAMLCRGNLRMVYHLFKKASLVLSLDVGPMHIAWVGKSKLLGLILKFSEPSIKNIVPLGKNSKYLLEKEVDKKITVSEVKKEINKILKK